MKDLSINPREWTKADIRRVYGHIIANGGKIELFPKNGDGNSATWAELTPDGFRVWFYRSKMITNFNFIRE